MTSSIEHPANANQHAPYFQHCPLPYLLLQPQTLHIAGANAAAAAFLHSTPQRLRGTCFLNFVASGKSSQAYGLLKKFSTGNNTPFTLVCQSGANAVAVQVFQNPMPGTENLVAVLLVPSPQQPVADSKESLMIEMVNEGSDVLTAADLDFKPIVWSKAAEQLYGISTEQALGKRLRDYTNIQYHGTDTEAVRRQALATGKWRGEMSLVRPGDGKKLTLLTTFKLIKDETGKPLHYFVSGTDITDRKEAEAKLRESENRFREVADAAPVGIWMSEIENKVIYINKSLADYTGVQAEAFTKAVWISLIHEADVHEVLKKFRDHFLQRRPVTLIYRLKLRCGAYHWVQDSGTPRFLADGTFLGYIGSIVDINATKRREEQLQYQATLMNHVLDSVVTTDLDFVVQSWNSVAAEIYGFTEAEVIGKRIPELPFRFLTGSKAQAHTLLQEQGVWKGEVDLEVRGEARNFLFTVTYVTGADGNRIGIIAVGREITDRKRAERALHASESFYRSLISDSIDGKLLIREDGAITYVSPSIQYILGYEADDICGRNAFEFVHPDDKASAWTAFQQEVSEKSEIKFIEIRILKPDGTWLWCLVRAHNMLANPHIGSIAISLHNDSERKQATDALKESEQRFRALIKDLKLGVILENANGKILMFNKATADLLHVSEAALETAHVYDLFENIVHEDESPFHREEWPMLRAARTKQPVEDVMIGICTGHSNERTWILVNSNPVLDDSGCIRHIITSFSDVTERKKLIQRLMEERINQQRLLTQASIDGQERERKEIGKELHDNIGQQLATTKLYLDLAREMTTPDMAEMLARATKSVTDVINEVRSVSHSLVPPTLGDLGLVESVNDLVESISLVQQLDIHFNYFDFCETGIPENGKLMLYRIIQEALNNIIKHARASTVHIHLERNKRFILLQVQDDGQGFVLHTVRKGLGLANIRNRAELFSGKVRISTTPGNGCTIKVILPNLDIAKPEAG